MKERVTLTIEKNILEKIDSRIDGSKVKNRSHAVELMLIKALSSNRPRKAIILAGGRGNRLGSIIETIPKPLIEVKGKPLLQWNIELLRSHGIKEIMISVGYMADKVKEYFGDGEKFGVKIFYTQDEFPLGTAGPIKKVKDFVTETTIVCNADELKDIDLDEMYEYHKNNQGLCTIALTTVDDPSAFGVALLNGDKIVTFIEKPSRENAPSNLINAGLYFLEPALIKYIPDGFSQIEQDVFPKLAKEDKLYGYHFSGQWLPTDTPDKLEIAKEDWKGIKS